MGERKVLNKYYPPDFDERLIPRKKREKDEQCKVRMMLPMSIRCKTCGEYIYKGKKFNSRKETVDGEEYLGVKVFRFYMRCTRCCAEFTIKTDPRNSDYVCEQGASRNYEPWREKREVEEAANAQRDEEDKDAMKALENKTEDTKQDIDVVEALEEIRDLNARNTRIDPLDLFAARAANEAEDARLQAERDNAEIFAAFAKREAPADGAPDAAVAPTAAAAADEARAAQPEPEQAAPTLRDTAEGLLRVLDIPRARPAAEAAAGKRPPPALLAVTVKPVKRKRADAAPKSAAAPASEPAPTAPSAGLAALGSYGGDSDSD